jgi:hypothetical protein
MHGSGGGSRSVSKPRSSSRSRSPPGGRRASHGDAHRRSHSNPRGGGHGSSGGHIHSHVSHNQSPPHHGRGSFASVDVDSSDNHSIQSGGGKRYRDRHGGNGGGEKSEFVKRNQMKPDKRMSESGLEEQLVELSQFLEHDSARFQSQQVRSRMRVSTSSATRSNK